MEANELMIGGWCRRRLIYQDTGRELVTDFQIAQIRKNGENLYVYGSRGNMGRVDQIEPIPLTEEILEKNGIKLLEVGDNGVATPAKYRNRFERWRIHTRWKDTYLWYDRITKRWNLHDMNGAQFTYVHEFQQLLQLCGIEKEIVL